MNTNELLPVEPLSPAARQRITEGVIDQLARERYSVADTPRTSRRRWWLGGGVAVAAAAVIALVVLRNDEPAASRSAAHDSDKETRIVAGDAPSTVTVGTSTLTVSAHAVVVVTGDDDSGIVVRLERGAVLCKVAPRRGRPPFRVQAGHVRVQVIGTKFAVARDGDDVRVKVISGVVRVTSDGDEVTLRADDRWSSRSEQGAAVDDIVFEPDVVEPGDTAKTSKSALPHARAANRRRAKAKQRRWIRRPHKRATPPASTPVAKRESAATLFRRAASLERRDPAAALALYRKVEKRGGKWAAAALFARASLYLAGGDKPRARRLARRYLRLYPRGVNAAMARRLANE